jgi:hypothetical protein
MKNQKRTRNQVIITVVVWATIILVPLSIIYWGNIKSFFAVTPQAKCEALIKSSDSDTYCTEAGVKQSKKKDELSQAKNECLAKLPYFQWVGETAIVEGRCDRVRYESRQTCIDDGRQQVRTVQIPDDEGGGSVIVDTRCLEDGTWKAYTTD